MPADPAAAALPFPQGGGAMGEAIRSHDWSATPLGPLEGWPASLRTAVGMVLASPENMCLVWGPGLVFIFNDSYRPILGQHLAGALGRSIAEVWPDAWTRFKPMAEKAFAGEASRFTDVPGTMVRDGREERTWWSFSFSPIRDEAGAVAGVLCVNNETTARVRAGDALRQSEERNRQILDSATDYAVVATDLDGRVTRWNEGAHRVLGWTEEEMLGQTIERFFTPEDVAADRVGTEMRAAREMGHGDDERWHQRKDGERFWAIGEMTVLRDEAGAAVGFVKVLRDRTEQRRAEEALRDSEADLRALNADLERQVIERARERGRTWQVSPEILGVLNRDGVFELSNPAWKAVLGWSEAEVARTVFLDFVHPDDLARTRAAWADATERGLPALRFENRYRHKEGGYRWLSWVAVPEGGKVYCSARDVTADKERAEALRQSETKASTYFNFSEDYLFLIRMGADGAARFEDMNAATERVMGLVRAEVIGRPVGDVVPPNSADDITRHARLCLATRQPQSYLAQRRYRGELPEVTIDGRVAFVERFGDGGGLVLFSGHDVTEQRAVEEALRQSQKMEVVGQLTGGVAHDFNNLLTIIRSSTDLLKRPNLAEERRARYVAAIADTVDRAAKITGQLLAFARRQALKPEVFAVCDAVRAVTDMLGTLAGGRIQLVTELPLVRCFVDADPSQFDTALVNMVVNARDAMDGEGRLVIRVQATGGMPAVRAHPAVAGEFVAVSLSDTGRGIEPDKLGRIFEPFFTTKEVGKGTGLGLSQVFGFAKQSGGEVTVESAVGEGTTFTLYLPRVPGVQRGAVADGDAEVLSADHGTRVLVVEDNPDVGSFSVQALVDLGYRTTLVGDAGEALAELAKDGSRFDVVFSDVMMPGMNGIELAREISRRYRHLPVVLTSGYSDVLVGNSDHGFELLHKPYSIEQLSKVLREAVTRHRRDEIAAPCIP